MGLSGHGVAGDVDVGDFLLGQTPLLASGPRLHYDPQGHDVLGYSQRELMYETPSLGFFRIDHSECPFWVRFLFRLASTHDPCRAIHFSAIHY